MSTTDPYGAGRVWPIVRFGPRCATLFAFTFDQRLLDRPDFDSFGLLGPANGVTFRPVLLRGFPASPSVAKARLFLRFKDVSFEEQTARLFRGATLANLIEALETPTLIDGDTAIRGASAIAEYLDQNLPERPLYPPPPSGARTRLIEQWVDRVLAPSSLAVRWLLRTNLGRSWESLIAGYAHLTGVDLWSPAARPAFREAVALRVEGAPSFFGRDTERINRFARACDHLDGALTETGWLAGPALTAADLAAYAAIGDLQDMDGWETVRARKRIAGWLRGVAKALGGATDAEAADAEAAIVSVTEAQAFVDARRLSQGPRTA